MTHPVSHYCSLTQPLVVGLISGTSADGIDAVLVRFERDRPGVEVLAFESHPYPAEVRQQLFDFFEDKGTIRQMAVLNTRLGDLFAEAALSVMGPRGADLIASHGQTIAHLPEAETTLQLAESARIAKKTGILTVADFRPADMAEGGQGAPLVPFFDRWLLHSDQVDRVALNIGGIANITWIPRHGEVFGCDTGPGNSLSDALVELHSGASFDAGGQLARQGKVLPELLQELLAMPYFHQAGQKSTGRELFGRPLARQLWGRGEPADLVRTACALTAESVWRHVQPLLNGSPVELVMAGGGTENPVLLEELQARLPAQAKLRRFEDFGVPAGAREAVAFALLGHRAVHAQAGSVPGATGARRPSVLGKLVLP